MRAPCRYLFVALLVSTFSLGVEPAPVHVKDSNGPLPPAAIARLGTRKWRQPLRDGSGSANVCFSPDGTYVLSTGDEDMRVWEAASGKKMAWAPRYPDFEAATWSTDGKTLITAASRRPRFREPERDHQDIEYWEVGTGRLLRTVSIKRHGTFSQFSIFHSGGTRLLGNDEDAGDKMVRIWDTASGKVLLTINVELTYWRSFSLSGDGRLVAMIAEDGRLLLHETASGKLLHRFEFGKKTEGFYAPALSPDGRILVASTPESLRIWSTATGKLKREIEGCRGAVAFSLDAKMMACGCDKAIRLWEVESLRELARFDDHEDHVAALAFSADGRRLVTGHEHTVAIWDVASGKHLNRASAYHGVVYSLAWAPDGMHVASGSDDGSAIIWDRTSSKPQHRLTGHYLTAAVLAYSPDGKTIATCDGHPYGGIDPPGTHIRVWNAATGRLQRQFVARLNQPSGLAYAPNGRMLIGSGWSGVRVWDPTNGNLLYHLRGETAIWSAAVSADSKKLLVGNSSGELTVYNAATGEDVRVLRAATKARNVAHFAFLEGGKKACCIELAPDHDISGCFRVWDTHTGEGLHAISLRGACQLYGNARYGYALSPDGNLLAVSADTRSGSTILLWDTNSGELISPLRGHSGSVTALAFSPDGKALASASRDTTILLWNLGEARRNGRWMLLRTYPRTPAAR